MTLLALLALFLEADIALFKLEPHLLSRLQLPLFLDLYIFLDNFEDIHELVFAEELRLEL